MTDTAETAEKPKKTERKSRYLLFVGNLPYNMTGEELREHFVSAEPIKSVRVMTNRETDMPRGFAFVELENLKGYLDALKLHNSTFKGRVINVEKTAGGGGNSDNRKKKLSDKNKKQRTKVEKAVEKTRKNR